MRLAAGVIVAALVTMLPVTTAAQALPGETPARLVHEFDAPFTRISGLVELSSGKLIVTDSGERRILLIDPELGTSTDISRRGQGPREYEWPFAPLRMPDDKVLVYDVGNRRFLELEADGSPVGSFSFPTDPEFGSSSPPRGVDSQGYIYWEAGPPFTGKVATRGWIVRWKPGTQGITKLADIQTRDRDGRKVLLPFITRDGWGVDPSGNVGIIRGNELQLEWHSLGGRTTTNTPDLPPRTPITDVDLAAAAESFTAGGGGSVRFQGGGEADAGKRVMARDGWITPEFLPAFEPSEVYAGPDQTLWARRRLPADADHTILWVFDASGELIRQIRVEDRVKILALAGDQFYATYTDDVDLMHLRLYDAGSD